jgi:hypothetical protein
MDRVAKAWRPLVKPRQGRLSARLVPRDQDDPGAPFNSCPIPFVLSGRRISLAAPGIESEETTNTQRFEADSLAEEPGFEP